ncbi:hypothetical protein EFT87_07870 [Schleiferilactobacillus harbinensis]|uniref:hypothetical protein n=1 Tax=Schleiferilactobacillus harbinensis TaxID=304207 RepID=UPI0021A96308|nr:hypothetical protein [Schleiferilactobacillus harbinensis]MCT2908579.1 hypothetical protein [Schleiferilactobacillus harbinensis]
MTQYVTKQEFMDAMHVAETSLPANFDQLADLASKYLDDQTNGYYQVNDINADPWPIRASKFKRAVTCQIAYMIDSGITTTEQAINKPVSETKTIGKTTVTKSWGNSQNSAGGMAKSAISADALAALSGTGLLYRGVAYVR